MQTEFHIGIDDTDSRLGGCTTYTAALLFQELVSRGFKPIDFPWLVRLNPNIPWKTRGNGALSIHFILEEERLQEVKKIVIAVVEKTTDLSQRSTDPAIVFLKGPVPSPIDEFSSRALHDILSVREARRVADAVGAETHLLKGSRGLVGPDPVLLGVRGEDPASVAKAFNQIEIDEPIERVMIFKTNQGTDAHLSRRRRIETLEPHQSAVITGRVSDAPRMLRGGHVIFRTSDETGLVYCAAYRATGPVREAALHLVPEDSVIVSGGIRSRLLGELTLNVEKLEVTGLVDVVLRENPLCSRCGARCESMGKGQGFRCKKCKTRLPKTSRVQTQVHRKISLGVYLPPPRTHRHLTKPASRNEIHRATPFETSDANIDQTLESLVSISAAS